MRTRTCFTQSSAVAVAGGHSGLRRLLLRSLAVAGLAAGMVAAGDAPALAITTTLNFDGLPDGTVVTTLGGATFEGGPTVFTPQRVATQSPPRALHTPSPCPIASIDNVCGRQTVTFPSPASVVSLRVGLDDEPQDAEIPTSAQLKAYNALGALVADSGTQFLGAGAYVPITTLLRVQSAQTDITRIVLTVGSTEAFPNTFSRRVNLDDLTFTDDAQPPVPAPAVRIDAPAPGASFNRAADVRVSGEVSAPAGLTRFCASTQSTIPAACNDAAAVDSSGRFRAVAVSGLRPGPNRIYVWVQDAQARVASASVDVTLSAFDLRPANIEVTQAVQSALPDVAPADFAGLHTATYNGVPLAAAKPTYVRVWTDARFTGAPTTVPDVRMVLSGTRDGRSLGAPLMPVNGLRSIVPADVTGPAVPDAVRSSSTSAYVFQLPASWTQGDVSLSAVINPPGFPGEISECDGCQGNDTLRLDRVRFTPVRGEVVTPVALFTHDAAGRPLPLPSAPQAFSATAAVTPFPIDVRPYQAMIDITSIANRSGCDANCTNGAAFDQVSNFAGSTPTWNRRGLVVGINQGVARGLTAPVLVPVVGVLAVMDANRPLTSVAHEFYHLLGFKHAGYDCPNGPGGFLGLLAESWDPDNRGRLQSFGFDPRIGSGGPNGAFAVAGTQRQFFDLMSYCTDNYPETNSWISARNWTRALDEHASGGRALLRAAATADATLRPVMTASARASAARRGRTIAVTALKVGSARPITRVERGPARSVPVPRGKRDATVKLLDADGDVVARAATVTQRGHVEQGPGVVSIGATLPDRRSAVRAEFQVNGKLLARVRRPRRAPKVRLLGPRRNTKVGSRGTVLVRWSVRGGRARTAEIDFAADGRRFRPIALGITERSYRVPVELLAKGRRARFRVRVSDGWNERSATSRPIAVAGPRPVVAISDARSMRRVAADGTLQLEGRGYGDRGRPLTGAALSWYHGPHLLGHGGEIRLSGLRAGRQRVRLVARTIDGRRSSRSVDIQVVRRLR